MSFNSYNQVYAGRPVDLAWTGELMRANISHAVIGARPHGKIWS